jgi:hypothetical protein
MFLRNVGLLSTERKRVREKPRWEQEVRRALHRGKEGRKDMGRN